MLITKEQAPMSLGHAGYVELFTVEQYFFLLTAIHFFMIGSDRIGRRCPHFQIRNEGLDTMGPTTSFRAR